MGGEKGSYRSLFLVLAFAVLLGVAFCGSIVQYQFQYRPQQDRRQNCITILTQDQAKAET